jgi:hypothetical protein
MGSKPFRKASFLIQFKVFKNKRKITFQFNFELLKNIQNQNHYHDGEGQNGTYFQPSFG